MAIKKNSYSSEKLNGSTQERALKTIAIRPTEKTEVKMLDELLKVTGQPFYSGALLESGRRYLSQIKELESMNKENEKLQKQLDEANRILNLAHTLNTNLSGYGKKFLSGGKHIQQHLF